MPSGGARSRSGPAPSRGGSGWIHLPAAGREGETPEWPLGRVTKFEREVWEREWRRPQAVMWERHGWEVQVALYVRTLRAASMPKASSATTTNLLRQMVNLGLTDEGLARNGWVIDAGPVAAKAPPRAATSSAKDRIRLLQGGGADARAS